MRLPRLSRWLLAMSLSACTATSDDKDTDVPDTDETDVEPVDSDSDVDTDVDTDDTDGQAVRGPCGAAVGGLVVGTGADAYVAVAEGAELNMVHGPQGGWHYDLALDLTNTPRFVSIEHTLTRVSDGVVVSGGPLSGTFRDNKGVVGTAVDDCVADGSVFGLRSILSTTVLGETEPWVGVCGEDLRFDVRVIWSWCARYEEASCVDTRELEIAMDSLTFVGQPDPIDASPCTAE